MSYWRSEDDIENDLYEISEFCTTQLPKPAPAPSKYLKQLMGKKSIYDDPYEDEEIKNNVDCIPIRGYPVNKNDDQKPGGVPSFFSRENTALIREVSGFGYSNDLIEHSLKDLTEYGRKDSTKYGRKDLTDNEKKQQSHKMPNLTLKSSGNSPSRRAFKVNRNGNSSEQSPSDSPQRGNTPTRGNYKHTPSLQLYSGVGNVTNGNHINVFNRKEFPDLR